jgi:two-component system response regulator (stage 0 sporulation protein F)
VATKLLIVDDQYGIRLLLQELFAMDGYEVHLAANGPLALECMDAHQPEIVLLDMKIPGMDGIEILRRLSASHPQTKVIMMTAYGELEMLREAKELGILTHFTKPFDIEELRAFVNQQVSS